ncbi:hypothetical protein K502DRAFT_112530 [Neoconidiobolus thromboides FSU 785]|nr:hypothetical protein K502DRAFT_112530 [Neoconidiobolus thromboides FSU 785]
MNVALVVKTAKPKVNIVEKIVAPIDPRPLRSIDKIKLEETVSNGNNILKRLSLLPRTLLLQQHFERGFRIYRAMEIFKENDHDEFQRRKSYLITLEDSYSELLNGIDRLSSGRRDIGIRLSHLGDACLSCLDSKYKIGPFIKCEERRMFKKFDKNLNCLAILTDDIKVLINIQANIEELQIKHLVDEYLHIISSLKGLMNIRTERLLNLKNICQIYDKSKAYYNRNLTETEDENRDDKELISKQELEKAEAQFEQSQLNLTQEFIHFEKYKVENLMKTLVEYTNLQLKVEMHHLEILNEGYKQFKADKS